MSASPLSRTDANAASGDALRERSTAARRLIAVTCDPALEHALQELADEVSVVIVEDLGKLTDEVLRHGSNLALLDSAVVNAPLEGVVDALTTQFPDLRLMVAGQVTEQTQLAARIANETVFRFVHKPASPQRLRLFLEAAAREAGPRRNPTASADSAVPRPPSKSAFVLAGLVALVVAIVAAWLFWPHGAAARLNARDLAKVQNMLAQAGDALTAKRYVSFDGSSAAELYRDVLQLDEVNGQARTGLDNALDKALGDARQALADGKLDAATNSMEAVRQISPQHPGLKELVAQVDAETRRQLADAKAREAILEREAQIHAAVDKVTASINSGALLDPDADNATTQFQAAQSLSPGDPAVRAARGELTAALVAAGEKAAAAHRLGDARRHATAAEHINSSAQGLAALLQHIDEAAAPPVTVSNKAAPAAAQPAPTSVLPAAPAPAPTTASTPASTPAVSAAPAPTPPPGPPTATTAQNTPAVTTPQPQPVAVLPPTESTWVPGDGVISTSKLKTLHTVAAEYPEDALAQLVSGWVELEFTVAKDGSVKAVEVTASEPQHVFDRAAMTALRRYRYAPVMKDGQPVEQRARLRMRFTATDQR